MTLARLKRLHKLPTATSLKGLREMEEKDIVIVADLFTRYMTRFEIVPICTVEELRHQLLSGMGEGNMGSGGIGRRTGQVTWSYVVEVNCTLSSMVMTTHANSCSKNPDTGKITDFFSFYSLPSTVINNSTYPILEAAYLYYYATETGLQTGDNQEEGVKQRLLSLIGDALVIANEAKFDVFNALTLMDNVPVLEDLKVFIF
jgi:glycylpeptide N-tetradecanoyltransferase